MADLKLFPNGKPTSGRLAFERILEEIQEEFGNLHSEMTRLEAALETVERKLKAEREEKLFWLARCNMLQKAYSVFESDRSA